MVVRAIRVRPPQEGKLTAFAAQVPPPTHIKVVDHEGERYLVWEGGKLFWDMLAVSSGPPVYVFDESGQLLDWTDDSGDNHRLDPIITKPGVSIDLEEALQFSSPKNAMKPASKPAH